MKKIYFLSSLLFLGLTAQAQECDGGRYSTPIFSESEITIVPDIKYGENFGQDGTTNVELFINVYYPTTDDNTSRPTVLLAHGGSFMAGDRTDMASFCMDYARRGYVAVTMSYRLITNVFDPEFMSDPGYFFKKEVVRAVHDMRAAVRYLKMTVAEDGNPYGIDANRIIVGGLSAGAITANHVAYMDTDDKVPSDLVSYVDEQGGIEGNSGTPGYVSSNVMTISYCGALVDTVMMQPGDVPFVGIHTDGDQVVPNIFGQPNPGVTVPVDVYGDSLMYVRALNIGIPAGYMMNISNDHCDFTQQQYNFVLDFVYEQICENELSTFVVEPIEFSLFPNPSADFINIEYDNATSGNVEARIYDVSGKLVNAYSLTTNKSQLDVTSLMSGNYFIYISNNKGKMASKQFVKR